MQLSASNKYVRVCAFIALLAAASALFLALVCGCSSKYSVTDMGNTKVDVGHEAQKIVCLSPAYTTNIICLGMGDELVAVPSTSDAYINAWAKKICPNVSQLKALGKTNPSADELKDLDADLVILNPDNSSAEYQKELLDAGVKAVNLNYSNYDEMQKSLKLLGKLSSDSNSKKIDNFCNTLSSKLDEAGNLDDDVSVRTYRTNYVPGDDQNVLKCFPQNSVVNDWVTFNGSRYSQAFAENNTNECSLSTFVTADCLYIGGQYKYWLKDRISSMTAYNKCIALAENRVYFTPTGVCDWGQPTVESYLMLDYGLVLEQPDVCTYRGITLDTVKQEAIDFYKDFAGTTFTVAEIQNMIDSKTPDGATNIDNPTIMFR